MKSESKLTPLTKLLRAEFGSVTRAAELCEVGRSTLWRWMVHRPERLLELTLYAEGEDFAPALIKELNRLNTTERRERGGMC